MAYKLFPAIALIKVCFLEIEVNLSHKLSLCFKKTFLTTYKLFPATALIKVCLLKIKVNLIFFSTKCISFYKFKITKPLLSPQDMDQGSCRLHPGVNQS